MNFKAEDEIDTKNKYDNLRVLNGKILFENFKVQQIFRIEKIREN